MRYYINDYGNKRMLNFQIIQENLKTDVRGVYTENGEVYKYVQEQFDTLEYFKSVEDFVDIFEVEEYHNIFGKQYYIRVVEDDYYNIFTLIYEEQTDTLTDIVEIRKGDVME